MFGTGECFVVGVACCARASESKGGDTIIDTMATNRKMTILVFSKVGWREMDLAHARRCIWLTTLRRLYLNMRTPSVAGKLFKQKGTDARLRQVEEPTLFSFSESKTSCSTSKLSVKLTRRRARRSLETALSQVVSDTLCIGLTLKVFVD